MATVIRGRVGGHDACPRARAMIQIESLHKSYGTRARPIHAVRDITLGIPPGVTAVVGPNGAGKTTLLGLVLGFLRPSSGTVRIAGEGPRRYLRRRGAAYLPERFRVPPEWPPRAALRALARLEGHAPAEADRRADDALDRLGLAEHAGKPAGALSRGLHQRLGIAQALLADRELVVLDEPTEGLDPLWRVRFRDLVRELAGDGRTVILASHELAEVERVADRAVLLDGGELREVMELGRPAPGPLRYRLDVSDPGGALDIAFADSSISRDTPGDAPDDDDAATAASAPDATADAGDRAPTADATSKPARVVVTVADPMELSNRLSAFLAAGGVVRAVVPLDADLEERVRRRLEES